MSALQIGPFCSNKANFQKVKLNVTKVLTKDYDRMDTWSSGKNKPNSNPIQTQTNPIKANKTPKQTQFKPKQTQFHGSIMLNCAICSANTSTGPGKFRNSDNWRIHTTTGKTHLKIAVKWLC
jgi:hypothetical protein